MASYQHCSWYSKNIKSIKYWRHFEFLIEHVKTSTVPIYIWMSNEREWFLHQPILLIFSILLVHNNLKHPGHSRPACNAKTLLHYTRKPTKPASVTTTFKLLLNKPFRRNKTTIMLDLKLDHTNLYPIAVTGVKGWTITIVCIKNI